MARRIGAWAEEGKGSAFRRTTGSSIGGVDKIGGLDKKGSGCSPFECAGSGGWNSQGDSSPAGLASAFGSRDRRIAGSSFENRAASIHHKSTICCCGHASGRSFVHLAGNG
jgi:hypothetical protein